MPRLAALEAEWQRHPPVHWLVAAYLDYKPPTSAPSRETEAAITSLVSAAPTIAGPAPLDTSGWASRPTSDD